MWECEWWKLYKTTKNIEHCIREDFPHRRSLAAMQLSEEIKERNFFVYLQCDIEVPVKLKGNFANFHTKFRDTLVSKSDIEDSTKNYAEEERL